MTSVIAAFSPVGWATLAMQGMNAASLALKGVCGAVEQTTGLSQPDMG